MIVKHTARAGTLESSDISVVISPNENDLQITVTSSVEKQYGDAIRATIYDVVKKMGVTKATIDVIDRGALDCTIRARVETALERAAN